MATESQLLRYLRNQQLRDQGARKRDVPKRLRQRRVIAPTRPLADAQQVLGHAPRGRKGRR